MPQAWRFDKVSVLSRWVTQAYLGGHVPFGAPDLHGALLHVGYSALLPAGQVGVGPGQRGHAVEGVLLPGILQRHNGRPKLQAVVHLNTQQFSPMARIPGR